MDSAFCLKPKFDAQSYELWSAGPARWRIRRGEPIQGSGSSIVCLTQRLSVRRSDSNRTRIPSGIIAHLDASSNTGSTAVSVAKPSAPSQTTIGSALSSSMSRSRTWRKKLNSGRSQPMSTSWRRLRGASLFTAHWSLLCEKSIVLVEGLALIKHAVAILVSLNFVHRQLRRLVEIVAIFQPQPALLLFNRLHCILYVFVGQDPVGSRQQGRHQEICECLVEP